MDVLPIVYLGYMFVSIYFLTLFLLLYFRNKDDLFKYPEPTHFPTVSFVVPAYNEGESIEQTIHEIFEVDYPNIAEVVVVNDASTDNTREILDRLKKKYKKLVVIHNEVNTGNAAGSQNIGLKYVTSEFVVVVDGDSYPSKDSIKKMIGFLEDPVVGAVTCFFIPRERKTFFERLQTIEYHVIAFTRKLLGYVDCIYVTPGPLALYRKSALDKIGGFDEKNLTQDIEATWALAYHGFTRRMCLDAHATTNVPKKIIPWYKQRRRWNIGGLQCISKYKGSFFRRGMLGFFIWPFFVLQLFLGLLGLSIFVYLMSTRIISNYLFMKYSIPVGTPLITMNDFFVTPSFLNYLGVIMFVLGVSFTILILYIMKSEVLKKQNIFNMLMYFLIYLAVYPFIMISALYYYFKGGTKWR